MFGFAHLAEAWIQAKGAMVKWLGFLAGLLNVEILKLLEEMEMRQLEALEEVWRVW
jgi:hypothetical protein